MGKFLLPKLLLAIIVALSFSLSACDDDDNGSSEPNDDIPADPGGSAPTVEVGNLSKSIPNVAFNKSTGDPKRIQINMGGIKDPVTDTFIELIPNETIFVTEDGVLQGIRVTKASETSSLSLDRTSAIFAADVVFTVDNSGSMSQEADSIAARIIDFVEFLNNSGLDILVGCVGYSGSVNGAINLTDKISLENYLNRSFGTSRTRGFAGPDSLALDTTAYNYASGIYGENGVVGITFADTMFDWRSASQRVYINFTDEPTQPNGQYWYSSQGLCDRWTGRGTIHTVWSGGDTNRTWTPLFSENPYDLTACTGGTWDSVATNASDLDLTTIPVTGVLSESVLIEYETESPDSMHTVKITVKKGSSDGEKLFEGIFYR